MPRKIICIYLSSALHAAIAANGNLWYGSPKPPCRNKQDTLLITRKMRVPTMYLLLVHAVPTVGSSRTKQW